MHKGPSRDGVAIVKISGSNREWETFSALESWM